MKNILMIATYFPPMGGVGTIRVTKYVKYLKKFNWLPTVVTIDEKSILNYDATLLKDIDKEIEIIRLSLEHRRNEKIEKAFYKELKKNIDSIMKQKEYDAVFITGGPFTPMKIAPYIKERCKIPYIIDLRDPWKLQKINKTTKSIAIKSKIKRFLIGLQEKRIFKRAFSICTVNDTMTIQYEQEYPKLKDKFFTIPNGYDPEDYDSINPKRIEAFSIIYTGKFNVSAGFRDPTTIFKAIKIVNEKGYPIHFMHIGEQEKKVLDIAKQEKIEKYSIFLGRKSYQETLEYSKGAGILLAIGGNEKSEQTGKIFDYIGCKRPIVVLSNIDSEINAVCKQIKNAYCIRKDNIDSMINTIIEIYENQFNPLETSELKEYTRENLTYELVKILEKIRNKK